MRSQAQLAEATAGGINRGPAMTFGYIAGRHAAGLTGYEQARGDRRAGGSRMTSFSLAHLTVLNVPPPEMIRVAARTGYDCVGLRMTIR